MTPEQLQAFADHMAANPDQTIIDALAAGNNNIIRDWYNDDASPGYWIFRAAVPTSEIRDAINAKNVVDITTADLSRVQALLDIRVDRGFSGEVPDDRGAWDDVFSAAAGDESQQAIAALWQRLATNVETVFALSTGTGADAANADTATFQAATTTQEVDAARELIP